MQKFIAIIAILSITFCSCTKENLCIEQGQFKGTFRRVDLSNTDFGVSQVTLNLNDGKFSGTSSQQNYPAIGAGNYSTNNDLIIFDNTSFFTADFDWSYILDGTFEMRNFGDSLILIKENNGPVFYKDEYRLKKE